MRSCKVLKVSGGKERIRYYLKTLSRGPEPSQEFDLSLSNLHERKTERYTRILELGAIKLRPGVKRLLSETRECGLRLGITITTTLENVTALLRSTLGERGDSWFEYIAAGDIVTIIRLK